jgi:formylglycine-generating enzyme required for sulfatase activity
MKNFLILFSALTALMLPVIVAAQPVVTNVTFVQEPDGAGSTRVRVSYDLTSPNGPCHITLLYSATGSRPFSVAVSVAGDAGANITAGTGKSINWAVANDLPGQQLTSSLVVRVEARDAVELVEFVCVPAGTFTMGNSEVGDDLTFLDLEELPRHEVTLSAYDIGKFEITNGQFATVMNWALDRGYLAGDTAGTAYTGQARVYRMAPDAFNSRRILFDTSAQDVRSQIEWTGSAFAPRIRDSRDMADYQVNFVSWYGAVTFCNFLAEMEGKPLAYNSSWELVDADPVATGLQYVVSYRLPTESEWERAASWDGIKHWIYGTISDTLSTNRASHSNSNPMGFSS